MVLNSAGVLQKQFTILIHNFKICIYTTFSNLGINLVFQHLHTLPTVIYQYFQLTVYTVACYLKSVFHILKIHVHIVVEEKRHVMFCHVHD